MFMTCPECGKEAHFQDDEVLKELDLGVIDIPAGSYDVVVERLESGFLKLKIASGPFAGRFVSLHFDRDPRTAKDRFSVTVEKGKGW